GRRSREGRGSRRSYEPLCDVPGGQRGTFEPTTQFTQHCGGAACGCVAGVAGRSGAGVPAGQRGIPDPTTQLTQHCGDACGGALPDGTSIGGVGSRASCAAGFSCSSTAQSCRLASQAVGASGEQSGAPGARTGRSASCPPGVSGSIRMVTPSSTL